MRAAIRPYTAVLIVPTGVGAAIGGYAGDALPVAKAIAQVVDCLITHPNVLNGAQLYWNLPNALYVEGYGLDQFAAGAWGLAPVHRNRIGLILDQGIEPDLRVRQLQAAEAARATLGLELTDYVITDAPLGVELQSAKSGATWGTIAQPDSLLRAADYLITQKGAEAIAVVARFPDDLDSPALHHYRQGQGVDPLAGAEAVISHLVVRQFQVPCAHAPALEPLPLDPTISPRSTAEEIGYTFLPCVLVGLSRAPQFVSAARATATPRSPFATPTLWAEHVDAVIVPDTAFGGSAVMQFGQRRSPSAPTPVIIAVQDNSTTMQVPPAAVGITAYHARSYLEAIGMLAAHRAGLRLDALSAAIAPLQGQQL